jgi:hypothetical protein
MFIHFLHVGKELDLHSESEDDGKMLDDPDDAANEARDEEDDDEAYQDDDDAPMISKTFARLLGSETLVKQDDSATGELIYICVFILKHDLTAEHNAILFRIRH